MNHTVSGFTGSVNMSRASLTVAARAITAVQALAPDGADGARHPGAVLLGRGYLGRGYQAFATGDIPAVISIFAADIDWHVPVERRGGPDRPCHLPAVEAGQTTQASLSATAAGGTHRPGRPRQGMAGNGRVNGPGKLEHPVIPPHLRPRAGRVGQHVR